VELAQLPKNAHSDSTWAHTHTYLREHVAVLVYAQIYIYMYLHYSCTHTLALLKNAFYSKRKHQALTKGSAVGGGWCSVGCEWC